MKPEVHETSYSEPYNICKYCFSIEIEIPEKVEENGKYIYEIEKQVEENGNYNADEIKRLFVNSKGWNIKYDYKTRREEEAEVFMCDP